MIDLPYVIAILTSLSIFLAVGGLLYSEERQCIRERLEKIRRGWK